MKVEIIVRVYEDSWPYATLEEKQSRFESDYLDSLQIGCTVQRMLGNAVMEVKNKLAKQEVETKVASDDEEAGIEGDPTTPRPLPRH